MSIRSSDGKNFRRVVRTTGDRVPAIGIRRNKAFYTATGGELSLNLQSLSPQISYQPGQGQLEVKSSAGPMIEGFDYYETSATSITFPSPGLSAGERLEIIQTFEYSGNLVAQVRPDEYSVAATAGQTVVTTDFSWPYNQNPAKRHGAIMVYLNGMLQQRGSSQDYTEVSLGQPNTNQIQFNSALSGGENISIVRTYQAIDETAAATQFNNTRLGELQEHFAKGFQAMVDESATIPVPFTTITNRARITNIANDLKVSFGIDRISVQSIYQLQNEFGASGELVWAAVNDDRGLIRFVGNWSNVLNTYGTWVAGGNNLTDYLEVTFYGTGLNLLCIASSSSRDARASVDGGSESSNIFTAVASNILEARNYSPNMIIPVVSGLTAGTHTVKIRNNNAGTNLPIAGLEILNTASATSLAINPGNALSNGRKISSLTGSSSLLAKPATITGGNGGRVVTYLNPDGSFGQAVQLVNAAPAYYTSSDHTNEEVSRNYYPREFGAGRADDFSTLTAAGGNRWFTLEDGTTTLVGSSVVQSVVFNIDHVGFSLIGSFLTLTFVGTGLDFLASSSTAFTGALTLLIDGALVGTINSFAVGSRWVKMASGLPYGTHTAKILVTGVTSGNWQVAQFAVYQPKKPSIPTGTVELADHNVMADFNGSATNGTTIPDNNVFPTGTLYKCQAREFVYSGAGWSTSGVLPTYDVPGGGVGIFNSSSSQPVQYTFIGSEFQVHFVSSTGGTYDFSVTIDGSLNATGVARGNASNLTGGSYRMTDSSGNYGRPGRIEFTGLSYGLHTVIIQKTAGTGSFNFNGFHIATRIHSARLNLPADLQNSLPIGSCSLSDSRLTSIVKSEQPKKAWAQAVGVSSGPTNSLSAFIPLTDLSVTVRTTTGDLLISFMNSYTANVQNALAEHAIFVDGVQAGPGVQPGCPTANTNTSACQTLKIKVTPGVHKIDVYWKGNGNILTANGVYRSLTVQEV